MKMYAVQHKERPDETFYRHYFRDEASAHDYIAKARMHDHDGEHEGLTFLEVVTVEREPQPCRSCGEEAENKPESYARYPYCRTCHYTGAAYEYEHATWLNEMRRNLVASGSVFRPHVEHTGGGCFWLAFRAEGEPVYYTATAGPEPALPEDNEGWACVYRYVDRVDADGEPIYDETGWPAFVVPRSKAITSGELGILIAALENDYFHELVGGHWWRMMQGDLGGDSTRIELEQLAAISRHAIKDLAGVEDTQQDGDGNSIEYVTLDERARRVARAYQILAYGGA